MDSEEELVPEGSVKDVESVKDSEVSLAESQGARGSKEPENPKPASFSPVPSPERDDMSLKSAQSEGLSGDSHRVLSPMPKTLAGPSVKEVMSPKPEGQAEGSQVQTRLLVLEKMLQDALPMLTSLHQHVRSTPPSPVKDDEEVLKDLKTYPPLPAPPGKPPSQSSSSPKVWPRQSAQNLVLSQDPNEPPPELLAQWVQQYKDLKAAQNSTAEAPFAELGQEDDRQSVSWSQAGSTLNGQLEQVCKIDGCDTIVDKNVKFKTLDISDPHTRGMKFILWQRDSRLKVRKLSRVALPLWDTTFKLVEAAYQFYLAAPQLEKAKVHPDTLDDLVYSMTKDYILDLVRSSLSQELSEYMLIRNIVELEELLFQLMIRAQPGSHDEVRKLLEFMEHPVAVNAESNKLMYPLTYKAAHSLLEKWEMVRNRLVELKQPLPNPLTTWPAVELIMERVLTLQDEFKWKVTQEKITLDITDNPSYDKIELIRSMYAVFCNQHIDDKRQAHPGPRGHTAVKAEPKKQGKGAKGDGKDKTHPPPPAHPEPRPTLSKLTVPGTEKPVEELDKHTKKHYDREMRRLCAAFSANPVKGASKGAPDTRKPEKAKPCGNFEKDTGCPYGGKCTFYHRNPLPSEKKCFRCGSKEHPVKDCTTPKYEPPEGKGKPKGDQKPKAKAAAKAAKADDQTQTGAASGSSGISVIKGDNSVKGKLIQAQMTEYFKSQGLDFASMNMMATLGEEKEGVKPFFQDLVSQSGFTWKPDPNRQVKLPHLTNEDIEVTLNKSAEAEKRPPCLLDSGCNNAATQREPDQVVKTVDVWLADGKPRQMGITAGETIAIPKGAQSLYPPCKADFYVGTFIGFGNGDVFFWHPKIGKIPVIAVKALPVIDPEVGDALIWELEQAVVHYHLTGQSAYTMKYPHGIVGILPPVKTKEEAERQKGCP